MAARVVYDAFPLTWWFRFVMLRPRLRHRHVQSIQREQQLQASKDNGQPESPRAAAAREQEAAKVAQLLEFRALYESQLAVFNMAREAGVGVGGMGMLNMGLALQQGQPAAPAPLPSAAAALPTSASAGSIHGAAATAAEAPGTPTVTTSTSQQQTGGSGSSSGDLAGAAAAAAAAIPRARSAGAFDADTIAAMLANPDLASAVQVRR